MGRELQQQPRILLGAQPSWGVDVVAAAQIHQKLLALRAAGCAILLVSEELDELFALADRLQVMAGGRLSPALARAEASAELLGRWMSGLWQQDPATAPHTEKGGQA